MATTQTNKGANEMATIKKHDLIQGYLGTMGPEEFNSESEIREYFSEKNLVWMFGDDANLDDAQGAMEATIEAWENAE
jgi:hypothetical protein